MGKVTVKTVELTGAEVCVENLVGQNVAVKNLGSSAIWASAYPNVAAGADNVVEIPAGSGEVVLDANGTVYLLGTGKAQCTGTPYATPNFKMPSSSIIIDGGGGEKSRDVICGKFEFVSGGSGIKSVPIDLTGYDYKEQAFAATLAAETGWELLPEGFRNTVLKDGVGFMLNVGSEYVYLMSELENGIIRQIDNYQYLKSSGTTYYMDICTSPSGAVAFGIRPEGTAPNIAFILTKDGSGDSIVLTTYYQGTQLIGWVKKGDYYARRISTASRTNGSGNYIVGMFKCIDVYSGGTFEDCYCIYTTPFYSGSNHMFNAGDQIVVEGQRFVIVTNEKYYKDTQPWIAMPIN